MSEDGSKSRWRKPLMVALGLVVGLLIAEGVFYLRDGGAFPLLNIYAADAEYGVVLRKNATATIWFGGGEPVAIRTNELGFRGDPWPAPADGEVLVLGDSQAFGLGVAEDATLSAHLQSKLEGNPTVLNAGVPTHGPPEYNKLLKKLLDERKPKLVVWVMNAYNDVFEANRPNQERHKVWDGWAVRYETGPAEVTAFPGRELLYRRSHLFFALRRLLYGKQIRQVRLGLPSEGSWRDVLDTAALLDQRKKDAESLSKRHLALREAQITHATDALLHSQYHVEQLVVDELSFDFFGDPSVNIGTARATPGDIVDYGGGGENSLPGPVTAAHIRAAVALRKRAEAKLRDKAANELNAKRKAQVLAALDNQKTYREQLDQARVRPADLVRSMSPLAQRIKEAAKMCAERGVELIVVALPMDVQVSADEWAKYGQEPVDMVPTRVLLQDAVEAAELAGARAIDATEALAQAQPGAFMKSDLHLTAKGYEALAGAIAAELKRPRTSRPSGGLPPGRSRQPSFDEWLSIAETYVKGSSIRGCITKRVREWVAIFCSGQDPQMEMGATATKVELVKGGRGEVITGRWEEVRFEWDIMKREYVRSPKKKTDARVMLIAPVLPGDELVADFFWPEMKSRLTIAVPTDPKGDHVVQFGDFIKVTSEPVPTSDAAQKLCACHRKLHGSDATCWFLNAQPDDDCQRTYGDGDDCQALLACSSADPLYPPRCEPGEANAGGLNRCHRLCASGDACDGGHCVEWQGGMVCRQEVPAKHEAPPPRLESIPIEPRKPDPGAVEAAKAVLEAAQSVASKCTLRNADRVRYTFGIYGIAVVDIYDDCEFSDEQAGQLDQAVIKLGSYLKANPREHYGPLSIFAIQAELLNDWVKVSRNSRTNRGLSQRFAVLASTWNEWQPQSKVERYSKTLLDQYRTGERTKDLAETHKGELVWQRCRTGACL